MRFAWRRREAIFDSVGVKKGVRWVAMKKLVWSDGEYEDGNDAPFGYDFDNDGRLVENAAEQNVLAAVRECCAAGVSLRRVAEILCQGDA
jgi:hypothetical protein